MKDFIPKLISFLFHPLLLPTYAVVLMFILPTYMSHYQYEYKKIVLLIIFILTFIFPVLVILVLINMKTISNLSLKDRKERMYPYAVATIIYIAAYYISINFSAGLPSSVSNFILTSTAIIFFVMLINFKIKVSAHMAGIGGFLSFFYILILKEHVSYFLFSFSNFNFSVTHFFVIIILLSGIIASSRLRLNAHNINQISLGFIVGFAVGLINIFF